MKEFKRINRQIVYKGAILDFCKDDIISAAYLVPLQKRIF